MRKLLVALVSFLLTIASSGMPVIAGEGQVLTSTIVTLKFKEGTLATAITDLQRATKVTFAYDRQLLGSYQVPRFSVEKETLEKVLQQLLQNKNLSFREVNRIIVISKKQTTGDQQAAPAEKKEKSVSGTVTDENNKPLSGVTVGYQALPQ